MRRVRRLYSLRRSTSAHLTRLRADVVSIPGEQSRLLEAKLAHIVIELLNVWTNYSRAFYLSCMMEARRESGSRITVSRPSHDFDDALGIAIRTFRPLIPSPAPGNRWDRRSEPTWHDPNTLVKIAHAELFSNAVDLSAAFSTGTRTFLDLPVFRNYFAHRNMQTQAAATNLAPLYGIPKPKRPSALLLSIPLKRTQMLIEDYLDDIAFTVEYMCH